MGLSSPYPYTISDVTVDMYIQLCVLVIPSGYAL